MRHGEGFDEPFSDTPPDAAYGGDYGASFDARLLIGFIILFLVVVGLFFLADYFGRRYGRQKLIAQRKASAKAIYESVRWYLDRALKSSGSVIIERGREVAEVLNARLGYVTDLSAKQYKLFVDLKGALEGMKDSVPADTTPKVPVALATDQHQYRVWKALQALDDFWKAKDEKGHFVVVSMIEAAQRELSTVPPKPAEPKAAAASRPIIWPVKKAKAVAAAAATPAPAPAPPPEPAPKPATDETPPPEPTPPPPPPPKKTKTLPAHKRSMLA
ncbi:hypothetical protein J2X24_003981 [Asticcacaulis solisilvae]|nr:hypothetical protein [Asticcacaulis solisilvae]MDR6802443.1 hypothetical protein [Asticcacaulis sp. BE141]